jgi:deoxyribodipyrimidine photolyase
VSVAIALVTRDLRVHDHAALASFLVESLHDLRASLRRLGGDLVVRRGSVVVERIAAATGAVHEPWRAPLASVAPEYPPSLARVA